MSGHVYLVGAGPGDPKLLTVAASECLAQAQVLIYDRLASQAVIAQCPAPIRIDVGKRGAEHRVSQQHIGQLMVEYAQQGQRVVRLKSGDPTLFGRLNAELSALHHAKVAFTILPGITAACAAAAAFHFSLTRPNVADHCYFITGHRGQDGRLQLDWAQLAQSGQTLVFYMGIATLREIGSELVSHGMATDTPALIVSRASRDDQCAVHRTVATLHTIEAQHILSPALLIVSAALHDIQLNTMLPINHA